MYDIDYGSSLEGRNNRFLDAVTGDEEELFNLIDEGEHQQQDFKFRIDSSLKIARTLSAFANTQGGSLLIGVKDNGKITGVDPQEEYYMIEGAAEVYCTPPVNFSSTVYQSEDKLVLKIDVPASPQRPHFAKEENGKKLAYIRQKDENFVANRVIISFLKDKSPASQRKNLVAYGPEERLLFDYLATQKEVSLSKFSRLAKIPLYKAEKILTSFLKWEVIQWNATDKGIRFKLKETA